ncbi:MAG: hypothetical protein ACXVGO_06385, partial [Mycobacterium sp.]
MNANTAPTFRRRLSHLHRGLPASLFTAGAIAGSMILNAPPAYAMTEQQIKSECAAANGTYATHPQSDGDRWSE